MPTFSANLKERGRGKNTHPLLRSPQESEQNKGQSPTNRFHEPSLSLKMAYQLLAPFFEDLNSTLHDLELLRQAANNATARIQQTASEAIQPNYSTSGCACGEKDTNVTVLRESDGMVHVNVDVLCCFLVAALIFGVLIGVKMAGSDAEDGKKDQKEKQ